MSALVQAAPKAVAIQTLAAIAAALCYYLIVWFIPDNGEVFITIGAALLILGLVRGRKLSVFFRVFISAQIFFWGFGACLSGRTMAAGLNGYTARMALYCFFICALVPCVCFLRLWRPRLALILICSALPICFIMAELVAGTEEYLFVRRYRINGIGPTPRWTVPHHWLGYDHEAQRLDGSD